MPRTDTAVLLVCVTVLVSIICGVAVVAFVFAPEGTNPTALAGVMVGALAPTIASMVAVVKVSGVSSQVADVAADTNKLANGLGDAKIRTAVADVLADDLVDPEAREQLAADRAKLDEPEDHA